MKANEYKILDDCVIRGIDAGWNRAHKHTDTPSEYGIKEQIQHYVMLEVCENFNFEDININEKEI